MIEQNSHQIIQSSQDSIHPQDFQNANALVQSIAQPRDSQPTKNKVKNFKNRVFQLLKIYADKSHDVNLLISCFKQDMFFKQPQKMNQLINSILNKQNIKLQNLQQLLQYYKIILLYKSQKTNTDKLALDFIRILKKIAQKDQNISKQAVLSMLKSFAFERKCTLKINFFFYLFRKYDHSTQIKQALIQTCKQYMNDDKLRNAQKKQLSKLLSKLDKTYKVDNKIKRQQIDVQQQQDIVATKKQNKQFIKKQNKVKQTKHENKGGLQKNQQNEQQKQGRIDKLKRIKQDKKKRKGNKQGNQNQPQNLTHNQPSNNKNTTHTNKTNNQNNNENRNRTPRQQIPNQNGNKSHEKSHHNNRSQSKPHQNNNNKNQQRRNAKGINNQRPQNQNQNRQNSKNFDRKRQNSSNSHNKNFGNKFDNKGKQKFHKK